MAVIENTVQIDRSPEEAFDSNPLADGRTRTVDRSLSFLKLRSHRSELEFN
jgi:hypothetical protein